LTGLRQCLPGKPSLEMAAIENPDKQLPEDLAKQLETDLTNGLTTAKAKAILQRDGPNELEKPPRPTFCALFAMQLTGFVIILLIVAAIASVAVTATGPKKDEPLQYTTGIAIMIIVLLNAGIAAFTESKAGDALEALSKMSQAAVYVVRDGQEVKLETPLVVRGDLVVLGTGDVVPADLRLVEDADIKVSEMALTGEPDDVGKTSKIKTAKPGEPEKLTPENMVFSGCTCTNGKGKGLVMETGMNTRIGNIARLISGGQGERKTKCGCLPDTSASQTPLQEQLETLGGRIGVLAIVVCIVIFVIGVVLDRTNPADPDSPAWLYMVLISVTLAVAAIPEGIPLCVTISLSIGCNEMVEKKVLVRKLAAVETLGSASVICTDKTGTLTEGKMTLRGMYSGDQAYDVTGKGFDPTDGGVQLLADGSNARDALPVRTTLLTALLCCNTTLKPIMDEKNPNEISKDAQGKQIWEPKGNSSEAPIVVAAKKIGFEVSIAQDYPRKLEVPFSSSRKMMLTVSDVSGRDKLCDNGILLPDKPDLLGVCKGAPNWVVDKCTNFMTSTGGQEPLDEAAKKRIMDQVDGYSDKALRVLAVAVKFLPKMPFDENDEGLTTDQKFSACTGEMLFVGLVASMDPDRNGVPESVEQARAAGIMVVMITGDYLKTAVAIAKNVKILAQTETESGAMDCAKLRPDGGYLPKEELDRMTSHTRCYARAKPEDKLEIVKSLQRQGLVAAMTGDGVNDAPALSQSDIGVAMGITGTEVAKGAADMILIDDNFCSIVAAVEKGRGIYSGIQKFVAFIMSVHIAEVIQIAFCVIVGIPVMRTPLQILFLILVTDLPPSIALGMEPGESTILLENPRPKTEPVVLNWMWVAMIMNGFILSGVIIAVYIGALWFYCKGNIFQTDIDTFFTDETERLYVLMDARTVAFISLVWSENVRSYIARSFDRFICENLCGNSSMQLAIVSAQIALYCAVLIPFFNDQILGLRGWNIGLHGWAAAAAGPVGTIILCELAKLITRKQKHDYQDALKIEQEKEKLEIQSRRNSVQRVKRGLSKAKGQGTELTTPLV